MSDDKRLSVSFGAFSCEIIGYEDPISVLNRTVAALQAAAEANPELGEYEEFGDIERARLTAALAVEATVVGVAKDGAHLVLTRDADGAFADEGAPRRKPLNITPPPESAAEREQDTMQDPVAEQVPEPRVEPEPQARLEPQAELESGQQTELDSESHSEPTPDPQAEPVPEPQPAADPAPVAALPETVAAAMADDAAQSPDPVAAADPRPEPATETTAAMPPEAPAETETAEPALVEVEPVEADAPAPAADPPVAASADLAGQDAPAEDNWPAAAQTDNAAPAPTNAHLSLEERIAAYTSQIGTAAAQPTPAEAEPPQSAEIVEAFPRATDQLEPNEEEIARIAAERMAEDDFGVDAAPKAPDGLESVLRSIDNMNGDPNGGAEKPQNGFLTETGASLDPDETDRDDEKPRRNFAAFLRRGIAARKKQEEVDLEAAAAIGFERLKKSAQEKSELDGWDDAPHVPISERQIPPVGAEALHGGVSPTRFAEYVRAASLHDLLEASAVYLALVDGRPRFSRRDVMVALSEIGAERDFPQQARLKSFRKLLTTGAIVRVDDGMYSVSESTWKGYRQKLVG